jgi:hypothetical protein
MKMSAYLCLGDPAWIEASVQSYYPYVSKIIATYDRNGCSWTGPKIDVDTCIQRLKAIDVDNKVEYVAGEFSIQSNFDNPILSETIQRTVGLDVASQFGDWVLQLDTDEIISNWNVFAAHVEYASSNSFDALYFPSISIYQMISQSLALESCRRWGVRQAGYPAPLCVRSGSKLYLARRSRGSTFHVTCRGSFNTVIESHAVVHHQSVHERDCVVHITKGRTPAYMEQKFKTWGHAKDRDYGTDLKYWNLVRRYPWILLAVSHLIRGYKLDKLRLFWLPASVKTLTLKHTLDGELRTTT